MATRPPSSPSSYYQQQHQQQHQQKVNTNITSSKNNHLTQKKQQKQTKSKQGKQGKQQQQQQQQHQQHQQHLYSNPYLSQAYSNHNDINTNPDRINSRIDNNNKSKDNGLKKGEINSSPSTLYAPLSSSSSPISAIPPNNRNYDTANVFHNNKMNNSNNKKESILTSIEYNKLLSTILCSPSTSSSSSSQTVKDSAEYKENIGLIVRTLLEKGDWQEKLCFFVQSFLGGGNNSSTTNSTSNNLNNLNMNAFSSAISTILRTRKQLSSSSSSSTTSNDASTIESSSSNKNNNDTKKSNDTKQHQVLDTETAEKLRQELICGLIYCESMMNVVQSILNDLNYPSNNMIPSFLSQQQHHAQYLLQQQHKHFSPTAANMPFPPGSNRIHPSSFNTNNAMNSMLLQQQQQPNSNTNNTMFYPSSSDGNNNNIPYPFPGMQHPQQQPLSSPTGMHHIGSYLNQQQQQGNNNMNPSASNISQAMLLSSGYPALPFDINNSNTSRNNDDTTNRGGNSLTSTLGLPNDNNNHAIMNNANKNFLSLQQQRKNNKNTMVNSNAETVAEGNPSGSTLRKHRPKSSNNNAQQSKSQHDSFASCVQQFMEQSQQQQQQQQQTQDDSTATTTNTNTSSTTKKISKKEIANRYFEMMRFRPLQKGDYVAARLSASRDLYIVMRVAKPYACSDSVVKHPSDLISMTEAKRASIFKDKVYLQDVEDYNEDVSVSAAVTNSKAIPRHQILPLPRTCTEASDWGTRCRKGYRVYAMYPKSTSLYCGTVIDNNSYCRGEDDMIVVEFDGDEDDYGGLPQRHIPARFVTLVPQGFPNAKCKRKRTSAVGTNPNSSSLNSHKKSMLHKSIASLSSSTAAITALNKK